MKQHKTLGLRVLGSIAIAVCATGATQSANAQEPLLNYDHWSFLEEPLATDVGDVTLTLTGLVEGVWVRGLETAEAEDETFASYLRFHAGTQLPNRWRVSASYLGRYASDPQATPDAGFASRAYDNYHDEVALSIGGTWGTLVAGNVSRSLRDQMRRAPGSGAASLAYDDVFGSLKEWSGGYRVRYGPWVLSALVDEDGDFDLGAVYQRPTGTRDYRLSTRYTEGVFASADGLAQFDTKAVSGVGEFIYGSALFDIGVGHERLSSAGLDIDQWFVSSGVRFKVRMVSLSIEGHYGRVEGEPRKSAALGAQYDLARGLSANFGLNYEKAQVDLGGVSLIASNDTKAVVSLRYIF